MDFYQYCQSLYQRLSGKDFVDVEPPPPLRFAMMNTGSFLKGTQVVGVCAADEITDTPATVHQRTAGWYKSRIGNNGAGLLIFVYFEAPAWAVDEINGLGGLVHGGAVDLMSNKSWMPSHLGWNTIVGG